MLTTILVANRGEIAVRIMRTIREMGLRSVAVYSEADVGALHVLSADHAVAIGGAEPAQSYLNAERIIAAALEAGADAVHPGYGFLAEDPAFARAVQGAGLVFIGPPADVIATLGDKTAARQLMSSHGVPIIPGMLASESDPDLLGQAADLLGYPLLIKAVAGGGGKGMRVVRAAAELTSAAEQASSEARNAFGNGAIYLERYLERPRHVEVQILADQHGEVIHLFERECSIQRRHQKLVEETPSPAVDQALRARLCDAAITAARAAGYQGAGTVEFLLDSAGAFYFLEVNARLQVEHPITELCVGLDLVRWQIAIADGAPLDLEPSRLTQRGHAIECRIQAEDPARGFMPCPGEILLVRPAQGPGVRFDSGIHSGSEVSVHYDPILGKLVVWAEDRPAAIARMQRALQENVILGVTTTTELLLEVMASAAFRDGSTHTGFLDQHFADWQPASQGDINGCLGFVADQLTGAGEAQAAPTSQPGAAWADPWRRLGAWDLLE